MTLNTCIRKEERSKSNDPSFQREGFMKRLEGYEVRTQMVPGQQSKQFEFYTECPVQSLQDSKQGRSRIRYLILNDYSERNVNYQTILELFGITGLDSRSHIIICGQKGSDSTEMESMETEKRH